MSPRTLPKVLKRTRDIKENVRKLAFQVATNAVTLSDINVYTHMPSTLTENNIIKLLALSDEHLFLFNVVVCFAKTPD